MGEGSYITLFSPSDVTAFHRMKYGGGGAVADPECARGGGVSHILAEKRGVSFTLFKNA